MISPNDPGILYSPYNWDVTSTRALTVCAGAWFRTLFNAALTSITLRFDVSQMSTSFPTKIAYRVNRQAWQYVNAADTVALQMPTYPSTWGKTSLEVVFLTSSQGGNRWTNSTTALLLTGIDVAPGGATTIAPTPRPLAGFVGGDSIVEGINTIGRDGDSTQRSDALYSWAYQLGDAVGADIGMVGFGGLGMSLPISGIPKYPDSWQYQAAGIPRTFTRPPDFALINLGTNDKNNNVDPATFKADYLRALNAMQAALPSTVIFVMMPFGLYYGLSMYQDIVASSAYPDRASVIDTTGWWSNVDSLDSLHPLGYMAPKLAALTANAILTRLKAKPVSPAELVWTGTAWA
ncbi:SGNH/GDSL hydrolase family protein [Curtobacterium sp. MCBA15_004]|uniref:SGNH/GDSL hydrolase family protein n=1 Tax=Curtobacterium sp. MCBA15_004 TaxID=1898733 RepID=UPI0008DCEF6E|nr:SGNH/GDSL hydrolase family protein [Curtobacterium sp. MCBA15_004]WIA95788.1 SGNH/GDSL hydrolase family protein [Curtobacterium sp. MCBA15_004]